MLTYWASKKTLKKKKKKMSTCRKGVAQGTIDAVFGYTRKIGKNINKVVPAVIAGLCLDYFVLNKETMTDIIAISVHKNIHHNNIKFENNIISIVDSINIDIYFQNVACHGIHVWKFRVCQLDRRDRIGIADNNDLKNKHFLSLNGAQGTNTNYACVCGYGDIIEMVLDLRTLSLQYSIFGVKFGKVNIEPGRYSAFIRIVRDGKYALINYTYKTTEN